MANTVRIGGRIEYLLHARSHMANTVRIGRGLNISYMPGRIWLILLE